MMRVEVESKESLGCDDEVIDGGAMDGSDNIPSMASYGRDAITSKRSSCGSNVESNVSAPGKYGCQPQPNVGDADG